MGREISSLADLSPERWHVIWPELAQFECAVGQSVEVESPRVRGSSEFEANLRRDVWLRHMVGTYDKTAELDSILTDLMEFAR